MKILSKFKNGATPVVAGLVLIALVASSCSSGTNSSAAKPTPVKSANVTALLKNIYANSQNAKNVDENISFGITNIPYILQSSGNLSPAAKRKEAMALAIIPKFSINLAASKTSSGVGNLNELIGFDYSSQPIGQIILTTKNAKLSATYFKVDLAALAKLPLPWPASVKNELGLVGAIIQPTWYKIPSALVARASTLPTSGTQKIPGGLKSIKAFLKNDLILASILPEAFKSQVITNQGGETINFSNNLYALLKWWGASGIKQLRQLKLLTPAEMTKLTISEKSFAQAKAEKLNKDTITASMEATSANELTDFKVVLSLVVPSNTTQKVEISVSVPITYNTQVTPPSNAVTLPPSILGGLGGGSLPSGAL